MLALALTAMVLVAVGMALDLNLRTLDSRRAQVEEAQLARAVLRRIADDLRSVVHYQPADMSSAQGLAGGLDGMEFDELDLLLDGDAGLDESLPAIASSLFPAAMPGLYGNQFELQVDISRLPRVDQYQRLLDPGNPLVVTDIPSDVKTVAYYLQTGDPLGGVADEALGLETTGLVRRELDRAVTLWVAQQGRLDELAYRAEMLAPEVAGLEFLYFDGFQWLPWWDSAQQGGLPLAIEILIALRPADSDTSPGLMPLPGLGLDPTADARIYRLVVRLPAAQPPSFDSPFMLEGPLP